MKKSFIIALLTIVSLTASSQENDSTSFIYHGHIYIPVVINDSVRCNAIYDTGAANLFGVDSVFLLHSAWKPQKMGHAYTGGAAGKTKVRIIPEETNINYGTIQNQYRLVVIFKLRDVIDCHVDGIMGIKNIADYPFEINFEHRYLKQYKTGKPDTAGYQMLPIKYEDDRLMFQVETIINGTNIKGWYLMDTGSGGSVDFTAKTVSQYSLETIDTKRYITDYTQFGIGDKEQEMIVDMLSDKIIIGRDTIHHSSVSYLPEGTGAFSDRDYLGVIGNDIWENYNIIIDAKDSVLYLRRFKPESPEEPTYDYNFRNRTDICRGWIVSSLVRDGDAIKAGIELGDTITAINGKSVADYSWDDEDSLNHIPQQVLTITGANGQDKQVTLEARKRWSR